jgi:hypothetical protein
MPRTKTSSKPNGHAGPQSRVNGHALASTERGGIPVHRDQAASDDTSRVSAAVDASSVAAPGTDCGALAEVASPSNGALLHAPSEPCAAGKEPPPLPCAEFPLPVNPGDFVEEIHRNADLFIAWERLLNSKDEKIRQRAVEKLTEMRYKGAALADEPRQIIIDMPRPDRD